MVNTQEIKAEMVRKKRTQRTLAKQMGMDKVTLNGKVNGKRPMKDNEIVKMCQVLDIKDPQTVIKTFLPELLTE